MSGPIVNQLLVDELHTVPTGKYQGMTYYAKGMFLLFLYTVLGCGLLIYFRTSISFLPYRTYAAIDYITIPTW
jgi:hypothetical protein